MVAGPRTVASVTDCRAMLLMVSEMLRSMTGTSYVPRESVTVCREEESQQRRGYEDKKRHEVSF